MRGAWLLAAAVLLAGCAGHAAPPAPSSGAVATVPDLWNGTSEQVVLDIDSQSSVPPNWQFDALCLSGGGVEMPRAAGLVLNGSKAVDITVTAPATATGAQLGYVLTTHPQYDETTQKGIQWLDPVRDGTRSFSVPVPANGTEDPDGEHLWHFFLRMNVPAAPQDCYTGAMAGSYALKAVAVKG